MPWVRGDEVDGISGTRSELKLSCVADMRVDISIARFPFTGGDITGGTALTSLIRGQMMIVEESVSDDLVRRTLAVGVGGASGRHNGRRLTCFQRHHERFLQVRPLAVLSTDILSGRLRIWRIAAVGFDVFRALPGNPASFLHS